LHSTISAISTKTDEIQVFSTALSEEQFGETSMSLLEDDETLPPTLHPHNLHWDAADLLLVAGGKFTLPIPMPLLPPRYDPSKVSPLNSIHKAASLLISPLHLR
jgi:hypothetical protein